MRTGSIFALGGVKVAEKCSLPHLHLHKVKNVWSYTSESIHFMLCCLTRCPIKNKDDTAFAFKIKHNPQHEAQLLLKSFNMVNSETRRKITADSKTKSGCLKTREQT